MNKRVLVLGCGPAGLFAAHAAEAAGFNAVIVSKKRKSEMFGAQYLHQPIPDLVDDAPFKVKYEMHGTPAGYRDKVYGVGYRGNVSPEDLTEEHDGWNIRAAYDALWMAHQDRIIDVDWQHPTEVDAFLNLSHGREEFGHYISTIPGVLLCTNPSHAFTSQKVWAIGDAPERGIFSPITTTLNTVVCNGDKDVSWYRAANILGYHTVEWPERKKPPIEGISAVTKPIATTCDCLPFVHRSGRYGKWTKGVLSHESFYETYYGLTGVVAK